MTTTTTANSEPTKGRFARTAGKKPGEKVTLADAQKGANLARGARKWGKGKKSEGRADRLFPKTKG